MEKKVVRVRETVKLTPTGELERWKVVEYMIGDFGPFAFEIRKKDFTWDAVQADMDHEEKGLQSVGK
jgi:hypothetical protein